MVRILVSIIHVVLKMQFLDFFHVVLDHEADKVFERGLLWVPAKESLGLAGVSQ